MKDILKISNLIIKKKLKILTAQERIALKELYKEYPSSKKIDFEKVADRLSKYETINKEQAWENIILKREKIQKKTRTNKPLFKKNWFKYAIAAMFVGVLATSYFYKNSSFNNVTEKHISKKVDTIIIPGSNKATLTLANGTSILLEKGASFSTKNANSNGEKLFYKNKKQKVTKIAYNYLTIPRGGEFFLKLSDDTKVWLNSETQLKYPVTFIEEKTRKVELIYGEAYFVVSPSTQHKGAKFKVINSAQEIDVLGTEFNIKAYKDETNIYTTLVEGKVLININDRKQQLIPKQQLNYNLTTNTLTTQKVDVYNEISWKDGLFSFDNKSLKEMMKVLSRWYDVDIIIKNKKIENEEFIGVLRKQQQIEDILNSIKNFGTIKNFKIIDKKIILE
ncbi:FecR family protein [Polaribacter cellanae]|uniref:FecR family protein n=1 Tax=Polaribacter cellanae TaxID=2818493 RepID=A0A975H704_9FLAO|nr:FecR family protein [Polaribacter cellanae]QTE22558.1 FecR family protein [Polaribacter cellanae]